MKWGWLGKQRGRNSSCGEILTMDIRLHFVFALVISLWPCLGAEVSKACFGSPGQSCTEHTLGCSNGLIAIQEAFYMNKRACPGVGKVCDNINVSNIKLDGTRYDFNDTELDSLYGNCSRESKCIFPTGRTGINGRNAFSAITYQCINETGNICNGEAIDQNDKSLLWNKTSHMNEGYTCSCRISSNTTGPTAVYALDMRPRSACTKLSITSHETDKNCTQNIQYQLLANTTRTIILEPVDVFDILWINIQGHFEVNCRTKITPTTAQNTGAIAGGVIGVLVVVVIVAAVLIWFKFVRNKNKDKKQEKRSSNHVFAGSLSRTAIQDGGNRNLKTVSNYDYSTIHDGAKPVGHAQNDYVLAGELNTENGTTVRIEDDYNHINHNPPQGASSSGYHTTASAAAAVKKMKSNYIDDDDYNHFGDWKPSVVSSDYDTTIAASKAVAQLGEMKDSEDDYDHFKRSEDTIIDSPYDTANHHSSVSADTTPSPYDLAK